MHESLMDFWLNEDAANCQIDGRFDPLAMRAIIRLMTQVMLLAEWSLDRLINEEPKFEPKLQLNTSIEAPEIDDPDRREKWIYLMRSALERTVNRFSKILRLGDRVIFIYLQLAQLYN
uniref:Uncharacterized protein n=2 Tax=Caenorhabditis japonica TaxID=281687 RepID=A0A8R1EG12_CAEJA